MKDSDRIRFIEIYATIIVLLSFLVLTSYAAGQSRNSLVNVNEGRFQNEYLGNQDIRGPYGSDAATEVESERKEFNMDADAFTKAFPGVNRSVRIVDGRPLRGDDRFWLQILNLRTQEIIEEYELDLSHSNDQAPLQQLIDTYVISGNSKMVICETSEHLSITLPGAASTYILDVEEQLLSRISGSPSRWRTWLYTWVCRDSFLILVNEGSLLNDNAVASILRVYSLEDEEIIDSTIISGNESGGNGDNVFVEAGFDTVENVVTVTRTGNHWYQNKPETWNASYYIDKDGSIALLSDEMEYAKRAKADVEDMVESLRPDPYRESKLRFIGKEEKSNGYVITLDCDGSYTVSYDEEDRLISISLPEGGVIEPEEISIQLTKPHWLLHVKPDGSATNVINPGYGDQYEHAIRNVGNIPVAVDIGYSAVEGCKAGTSPGKDTFVVECDGQTIPPEGRVSISEFITPGGTERIPLRFFAPTELYIDVKGMSVVFDIRAYPAETQNQYD